MRNPPARHPIRSKRDAERLAASLLRTRWQMVSARPELVREMFDDVERLEQGGNANPLHPDADAGVKARIDALAAEMGGTFAGGSGAHAFYRWEGEPNAAHMTARAFAELACARGGRVTTFPRTSKTADGWAVTQDIILPVRGAADPTYASRPLYHPGGGPKIPRPRGSNPRVRPAQEPSGYRDCACRDCFDVAIGTPGALCRACEGAGCERWPGEGRERRGYRYECQRDDAYGAGEEEWGNPPRGHQVAAMIRRQAEAMGHAAPWGPQMAAEPGGVTIAGAGWSARITCDGHACRVALWRSRFGSGQGGPPDETRTAPTADAYRALMAMVERRASNPTLAIVNPRTPEGWTEVRGAAGRKAWHHAGGLALITDTTGKPHRTRYAVLVKRDTRHTWDGNRWMESSVHGSLAAAFAAAERDLVSLGGRPYASNPLLAVVNPPERGDDHLRALERRIASGDLGAGPALIAELRRRGATDPALGDRLILWRGPVRGTGGGLLAAGQAAEAVAVLEPRRGRAGWSDPRAMVLIPVQGYRGPGMAPARPGVEGIPPWVAVLEDAPRLLPGPAGHGAAGRAAGAKRSGSCPGCGERRTLSGKIGSDRVCRECERRYLAAPETTSAAVRPQARCRRCGSVASYVGEPGAGREFFDSCDTCGRATEHVTLNPVHRGDDRMRDLERRAAAGDPEAAAALRAARERTRPRALEGWPMPPAAPLPGGTLGRGRGRLVCPECSERAVRRPPRHWGGMAAVEPERRRYSHADGEPLCPVMTAQGYQPAFPVHAAQVVEDEHAVTELVLYAETSSKPLYLRRQKIERDMIARYLRGDYDPARAMVTWQRYADEAAATYTREYGTRGPHGRFGTFDATTRRAAAIRFAQRFAERARAHDPELEARASEVQARIDARGRRRKGPPHPRAGNPLPFAPAKDKGKVGRMSLERARKAVGDDAHALAKKAARRFHDHDPVRVTVYRVDDGFAEVTRVPLVGLGRMPEVHYVHEGKRSNKAGKHWVHETPRGSMPLLTYDPVSKVNVIVGGTMRTDDWLRK